MQPHPHTAALAPPPTAPTVPTVADLMRQCRLSYRQVAKALCLSLTTTFQIIDLGEWPKRMTPESIKAHGERLEKLFAASAQVHGPTARAAIALLMPDELRPPPPPPRRRPGPKTTPLTTDTQTPDEEPPMLMAKQTLTPSARRVFGVFANPFDGEVQDESQMFTNGEIAYVREACMQAALGGRFVAVVSESGGGKTTMLQDLEARLQEDRRPVITIKPWVLGMEDSDTRGKTLKSADILHAIITTLDPLATPRQTLQARSDQARLALAKSTEAGYSHMLVIEEAHSLPEATLKHLKRLHEMRMGRRPLLGILLLGQTELGMRLDPRRASLREVTQRCEVVHLLPLDSDLRAYLDHRARAAGAELSRFIDDQGIDEIRARLTITRPGKAGAISLTYPLAVNNLMTAAMNLAAELGAPIVTRDIVRGV